MDGVEAPKQIRNVLESNIPIVALTANAFKHDIDLYLPVGMNDYLLKPYREDDLYEKIAYYTNIINSNLDMEMKQSKKVVLYDLTQLIDMSRGDDSFVKNMTGLFKNLAGQSIAQLNEAFENKDVIMINKTAHKIKPSIDSMGIVSLTERIRSLEKFNLEENSVADLKTLITEVTDILQLVIEDI